MVDYNFILKCKQCDYEFTTDRDWIAKLKCGAHRRYFKHNCSFKAIDKVVIAEL